ncbi:MAG: lactate racemase domain-containing protein, partial [Desulfobulbia bacterium]
MIAGLGSAKSIVSPEEMREIVATALPEDKIRDKRLLVLTPDATRTCPLPEMVRALHDVAGSGASRLDFMIALGTHTPLSEEKILELYGIDENQRSSFTNTSFLNHRWDLDETMTRVGWIEAEEIEHLSGGRLKERVPVDINRAIFDYDLIVICGPVFPHEVVGYSGGAKY